LTLDANAIAREHGHDVLRDILDVSIPIARLASSGFGPAQRRSRIKFERTSTNTIMSTKYPPIKWVIPGYVSEGFIVLAGRQKLGKTWLAIDWALAVATGGVAMGSIDCQQGDVLYIDMENGPRRIQGRVNTLLPMSGTVPTFPGWNG
jgi:hypothetical protein